MMVRLSVARAFAQWMFMKMFHGTFEKLDSFRYNLKRGAPDSIFAIFAFIIISILAILAAMLITAGFTDSTQIVKQVGACTFWTSVATLVYNIGKAAYECFEEERYELIESLKATHD